MKLLKFPAWTSFLLFPKRAALSLSLLGVASGVGVIFAMTDTKNGSTTPVLSQLHLLQTKIEALQDSANKPLPEIDLSSMTQQVQQLSQQLDTVRAQTSAHFNQALYKTEMTLSHRLDAILALIHQLNRKQEAVKFLSPNALPFQVISLDSIQQMPVASVRYDFKTVPLEKDDSLAGWLVINIDYVKQCIEFENSKKEHVLLTHEHIA